MKPAVKPNERPTMKDQAAGNYERDVTCPECGKPVFVATSTWYQLGGDGNRHKRRSRTCRACSYTDNETVPVPVRDADTT